MQNNLPIIFLILSAILFSIGPEIGRTQKSPVIYESVKFTDITKDVGIQFRDENGESGKKYFIEAIKSWFVRMHCDKKLRK